MGSARWCFPAVMNRNWWEVWEFPERIYDQHFGNVLCDEDMYPPAYYQGYVVRLRTKNTVLSSGQSEVNNGADIFRIKLNVVHFKPEEIVVKVVNNYVVIHCKHEEVSDDQGFIAREFTRWYILPEGTEAATITAFFGAGGILVVEAPKSKTQKLPEHSIPINIEKKESPETNSDSVEPMLVL